jgi:F-type H+-transporting ATPase subunit b
MFTPEAMASYAVAAILTLINLTVSYLVLKRFLFKPILKLLRQRKEAVEQDLSQAEVRMREAQDKLANAELRLDKSSQEAADIIQTARGQAEVQREAILSDAKREAAGMLARADGEIDRMRVSMLNEIRDEVADLSVAIASKVIGKVMDEKHQRQLVDQFLDEEMAGRQSVQDGGES